MHVVHESPLTGPRILNGPVSKQTRVRYGTVIDRFDYGHRLHLIHIPDPRLIVAMHYHLYAVLLPPGKMWRAGVHYGTVVDRFDCGHRFHSIHISDPRLVVAMH